MAWLDEAFFVEPGKGAADSGATRAVVGSETWQAWAELLPNKGRLAQVVTAPSARKFRFGNGQVLTAKFQVTFEVDVFGSRQSLTVCVVPGSTPLLIARPDLESWGLIVDFRNKRALLLDDPDKTWHHLTQSDKGHFVLDLLGAFPDKVDQALAAAEGSESSASSTDDDDGLGPASGESDVDEPMPQKKLIEMEEENNTLTDTALETDVGWLAEDTVTLLDAGREEIEESLVLWFADVA